MGGRARNCKEGAKGLNHSRHGAGYWREVPIDAPLHRDCRGYERGGARDCKVDAELPAHPWRGARPPNVGYKLERLEMLVRSASSEALSSGILSNVGMKR